MCAIAGIINLKGQPVDATLLRKMNEQLRHRGPDDEGYTFIRPDTGTWAEYSGGDSPRLVRESYPVLPDPYGHHSFSIGLAHRRFSIVDLTTRGHQPFFDAHRVCCLVFNGEIFNYLELRDELVKRGHLFRSASDTEVIVEAYKAWGADCFSRFNGMWTLALYDFRKKRLIISRDRLGESPLYWTKIQDSIYFASEIKALLYASNSWSVNEKSIHPYLANDVSYVNDETFFKGIFCVSAATWGPLDENFPSTVRRYWKAPEERLGEHEVSVPEATTRLRDTLRDAVGIRLRSEVPWCVALSGGLDSSVLLALAAQISKDPVIAHTLRFPEKQWDEEWFARAVARHCGVEHRVVEPPLHNFWHEIIPFTYLQEEPYHAPNIYTRQLLHRSMRTEGFKVVLVGEGGDELFAGYKKYFRFFQTENLLAHRFGVFLNNSLRWSETNTHVKPLATLIMGKVKSGLRELFLPTRKDGYRNRHKESERNDEYLNRPPFLRNEGFAQQTLSKLLYDDVTSIRIPYWVRTNDRMRMGIPLEGRSPFLDYRVVELALTLPVTYLIRNGWHKWIVRKAFQELLPKEVVWRKQKSGFPVPLHRFFLTSPPIIRALFQQLSNPHVDLTSFEEFANYRSRTRRREWGAHIDRWRMTSFLLWYELFMNHNLKLFSRIREELGDGTDYVDDKFVPAFLHSYTASAQLGGSLRGQIFPDV